MCSLCFGRVRRRGTLDIWQILSRCAEGAPEKMPVAVSTGLLFEGWWAAAPAVLIVCRCSAPSSLAWMQERPRCQAHDQFARVRRPVSPTSSCGGGCLSPSAQFALDAQASDSGVELRSLVRGRSTVAVSIPATCRRSSGRSSLSAGNGCGDICRAKSCCLGRSAAVDPVDDVMSVTPLRRMITAREGTSTLPGNQRHGLAAGSDPSGSA